MAQQRQTTWRYPGARPFEDVPEQARVFHGRQHEILDLGRRIRGSRLLVLYGKSGTGKTSLLKAGVFPDLRNHGYLPIPVRVNDPSEDLARSVLAQALEVCKAAKVEVTQAECDKGLWVFFRTALFWQGSKLFKPVLVIDQFEEIFSRQDRRRREAFADTLGELLRPQAPLGYQEHGGGRKLDLRLVLSLRSDYVGQLEEIFPQVPQILGERYLLSSLSRKMAERAIREPARSEGAYGKARFDWPDSMVEQMLDFLGGGGAEGIREPFLLQLLCRHVESRMPDAATDGDGNSPQRCETAPLKLLPDGKAMTRVVRQFYRDKLAAMPGYVKKIRLRRLCEVDLLDADGRRRDMSEALITKRYGISRDELKSLERDSLLRSESRGDERIYEIAHDRLARTIADNRRFRMSPRGWAAMAMVVLAVAGFLINAYQKQADAEADKSVAIQKQLDAEAERRVAIEKELTLAGVVRIQYNKLLDESESLRSTLDTANARVKQKDKEIDDLNLQIQTLEETTRSAQREASEALKQSARVALLETRMEQDAKQLETLRAERSQLTSRVDALTLERDSLQTAHEELQRQLAGAPGEEALQKLNQVNEELRRELVETRSGRDAIAERANAAQRSIVDLEDRLAAIQAQQQQSAGSIAGRLQTCAEYLSRDWLTTGSEGNALSCYRGVLESDPGNTKARDGVAAVLDRYGELVTQSLKKEDADAAGTYLERMRAITPDDARLAGFEKTLDRLLAAGSKASIEPTMVKIPGGLFVMGSPETENGRDTDEGPRRKVRIAPFLISRYEITFEEYDAYVLATGGTLPDDQGWGRGGQPVINVSWEDARSYAAWLSKRTGSNYRLPSEAEWEYAARAGSDSAYWWGDKIGAVRANCDGCGSKYNKQTAPVGSFEPNPFGLYDTSGNVWEWVEDCWHNSYKGAPDEGAAWLEADGGNCERRVVRGGGWYDAPFELRSAFRNRNNPDVAINTLGFRLARTLD